MRFENSSNFGKAQGSLFLLLSFIVAYFFIPVSVAYSSYQCHVEPSVQKRGVPDDQVSAPVQEEEKEDLICCCLCYCAVDYSDKSYFCQIARDADSDLDGEQPLLLPIELYDPNNALVFCDSCDRPYHQRCHFVPAIHLPRGDWNCFICTTAPKILESKKSKKQRKADNSSTLWTETQLTNQIYQMNHPSGQLELQWEYDVRAHKVLAFKAEMRRLQGAISVQMQNIRLAQMTIKAFTTSRRKTSVDSMLKSQELCQALVKVSSAKLRVRQLLQSLEKYMKGDDDTWNILQQFLKRNGSEVTTWFPLVQNAPRRMAPRLKDTPPSECPTDSNNNNVASGKVPRELRLTKGNQSSADDADATTLHKSTANSFQNTSNGSKSSKPQPNNDNHDDDDDASGISLDNLKCVVCFKGDATDDNDLLMCDGQGCFRAHHMHCHTPVITESDAQDEEDWFCPLCKSLAKLVADVQSEYTGDEWYNEDAGSVASWECANDVFPEAPEEHEMAMKWKLNNIDAETKAYLNSMFGDDDHDQYELDDTGQLGHLLEDDDDEEDDDDFDPNGKTRTLNDNDTDEESDTSSKATLGELSIELKIGRHELDALSGGESSSNEDEKKENGNNTRRSRRVRSTLSSRTASRTATDDEKSNTDAVVDVGKLDESNIILGKRRRRKIDYALLNDCMFGGLSAADRAKIDDEVEFQYKAPTRRETSSDSDDDSNDDSGESSDASHDNNSSRSGNNMGRNDDTDNDHALVRKIKKLVPAATGRAKKGNEAKKKIPRSGIVVKKRADHKRKHSEKATPIDKPRKDKSESTSGIEKKVKVTRKSKRPPPVVATGKQRRPPAKRLKTRKET